MIAQRLPEGLEEAESMLSPEAATIVFLLLVCLFSYLIVDWVCSRIEKRERLTEQEKADQDIGITWD